MPGIAPTSRACTSSCDNLATVPAASETASSAIGGSSSVVLIAVRVAKPTLYPPWIPTPLESRAGVACMRSLTVSVVSKIALIAAFVSAALSALRSVSLGMRGSKPVLPSLPEAPLTKIVRLMTPSTPSQFASTPIGSGGSFTSVIWHSQPFALLPSTFT
jgi:hypothetical protein